MFGAPFSPKRAACGAQRRPRRCGRQICRFFFSRSPSSPCAADPSAASAAIVTDLRCRRGKIHDSSFKKCFDGFAGNFWYFGLFRRLLLFFVLRQRNRPLSLSVSHSLASFPGSGRPSQALRASSPRGGATGVPGHSALDAQGPIGRKRAGLAYGGSGFWTRAPCQAAVDPDCRALLFPDRRNFARPAWA